MGIQKFSKSNFYPLTFDDDDDEYLSAYCNVDFEDLPVEIINDDEELAAGFYHSLPDICLPDFDCQLTAPLCPLMSDHDFLRYYSLNPPSLSGLVLVPKYTPHSQKPRVEYVSLVQTQTEVADFSFLDSLNLQIVQSCNGLFLCYSESSKLYHICNVATQHVEVLPSCTFSTDIFALNLAFDPYYSPYYKVICVQKLEQKKSSLHQISIYSSATRTWTSQGKPFAAPGDLDFSLGVFCHGAMHWMRRGTKGLYLNVEDEVQREMPKPPFKEGYPLASCEYFGESQGHLYFVVGSPQLSFLELFEMKEDYSGWFLRNVIDLKALAMDFPVMGRKANNPHPLFPRFECDVLCIIQGHDDEHLQLVLSIPGEVIMYDHEKKSAKKLCDVRLKSNDRAVWYRVYSSYQVV